VGRVTQGSQSLALGLALAAASQLMNRLLGQSRSAAGHLNICVGYRLIFSISTAESAPERK
jgi:hypothetical protein